MKPQKQWQIVSVYSITHFLVDFSCAFLMFRSIAGTQNGYVCVLLYNFCAFAMQMPIGVVADKLNRNYLFAAIGCIIVGAAYGLVFFPIASAIVVGIGNALFHIGGGIDVLNISGKKLAALGIFVSPGAFGIYYGTMFGKGNGFPVLIVLLALIMAATSIYVIHKLRKSAYPQNVELSFSGVVSSKPLITLLCLFLVVCLRSFVGLALDFSWKGIGYWGTALICATVFGKAFGGFKADRIGLTKTVLVSLCIAALLFLLPTIPLAGVMAVFLFNMTMPITLWAAVKVIPGAKGFAFGLLAFGLFIGFLPVYLGIGIPVSEYWLYALISAVSLAFLAAGLRRAGL